MEALALNYQSLMDQYAGQKRIEVLGLPWLIESVVREHHPVRGPEVRLILAMQPDPAGKCVGGAVRLVFRDEVEDIDLDAALRAPVDHLSRCKEWALSALVQLPTGAAFSTLINAILMCEETQDHEAIARGRREMLAGRMETPDQFKAFVESIR